MPYKITVKFPGAPLAEELTKNSLTNFIRANNLIEIYEDQTKSKKGRKYNSQIDILRAAVVLIHATLEDGLRSIARHYFPLCEPEVLDRIPLLHINKSGRPEKFFLGRLREHSGVTVDELVQKSIESYIEKLSFSSVADIADLLTSFRINQSKLKPLFPLIEEMIQRRHHIVHMADRTRTPGRGKQFAMSLSSKKVKRWNDTVNNFIALIADEYMRPILWPRNKNADDKVMPENSEENTLPV